MKFIIGPKNMEVYRNNATSDNNVYTTVTCTNVHLQLCVEGF